MPGVFVVTDSSCDLEQDDIDPFDLEIVPLTIRFGSDEFADRQDLSVEDFYQRMANAEELPRRPARHQVRLNKPFATQNAGSDAVVCLTISSDLSTTFQSALTAATPFEGQMVVHVIDSRTVSSGLGTLVIEAAKLAAGGADIDNVVSRVGHLIPCTHVLAALHTLENLKKGGRIGSNGNAGVTAVGQTCDRPYRWCGPRSR